MVTRSGVDVGRKRIVPGLGARPAAALLALFVASLACSRADAPIPDPTLLSEPASSPTEPSSDSHDASLTQPTPSPLAAVTSTPSTPEVPVSPTPPPTPTLVSGGEGEILYYAQPGDTLRNVALRFAVVPGDITSPDGPIASEDALIDLDRLLIIPRRLGATGPSDRLIPDSEMVFSPHAADFDVSAFVASQGGFLNDYQQYIGDRWRTGAEVVALAARDHSVNPRLLLALLEYHSGWLTDPTRPSGNAFNFPLGHTDPQYQGLYKQLTWLSNELGKGYYAWRAGTITELAFGDGTIVRLAPELNAGTVALQAYFAGRVSGREWAEALGPDGFIAVYKRLFGDPWSYFHPLYEPGVHQPPMVLPFAVGHTWAFTGGPHGAWEREAAWAALDFAPPMSEVGCQVSTEWALAAAPGLVLRTGTGLVVLDLDGDGREQTGWVLIYLHIAEEGRVQAGTFVEQDDPIGHPSCEGGIATGSHIHIARKYNGEWVLADGPLPFELSGWIAHGGSKAYQGSLTKGDQVVLACPCSSRETFITR